MQTHTLIQTKLQPPFLSPDILPRTQLVERLNNGRFRKLTLISAPAGYGKSVLASMWQAACDCPVAWISLDENDNDLGVFLNYLVHAIQTIFPDSLRQTAVLLKGVQLPSLDILTTSLINETALLSRSFVLFLDDFHLIHHVEIHQFMRTFIGYQATSAHLVLITRQDPPLDINNLRAKNELNELRLVDLRFSNEESVRFLENHLKENLPQEWVQTLIQHTEGWPAGLRLTVLAMRHQVNQLQFVENIQGTGTTQFVMSYLVSQVLLQQPQAVQSFLLATSLLERFSVSLCTALLQDDYEDNRAILQTLQRDNLFLIALDHKGEWFRYHHLFRDLLRHQLKTAVSDAEISNLHIRASNWFAQEGFIEEALDHAFLAHDTDLAVEIVAEARYTLMNNTEWQKLQKLLHRFPQDVINRSPELLMAEAWLIYHHDQYAKLPDALARLNQLIDELDLHPESRNHLSGEINALYSMLVYFAGDVDKTISLAKHALKHTAPALWIVRVFARLLLAAAQQMAGDLTAAYTTLLRNFDEEPVQNDLFKATTLVTICQIEWVAADLKSIQHNATEAAKLCQNVASPEMHGQAHYYLGVVAYLQNDLVTAEEHFSFTHKRPYVSYSDSFAYSSCGLALTYAAQDRDEEAQIVVDAALAFFLVTGNTQLLKLMKAFQAELAYQQGQLSNALQWIVQFDSLPPLAPMYRLYDFHFTMVKIWLAENTADSRQKAANLLAQIKAYLESIHNNIFLMQTMVLQAVSEQLQGDEEKALTTLEQALTLALPSKIIRFFVDAGPVMANLLTKLVVEDPEVRAYKSQILAAMPSTDERSKNASILVDPLTERELEILFLLVRRYTDKEIAQKLVLSPHTVHTHIKHIFNKLDVHNRKEARKRAKVLGLISSS